LPYNDRFLLLYYKQYKNSVEIFVETWKKFRTP
jgi:hypothetical protein